MGSVCCNTKYPWLGREGGLIGFYIFHHHSKNQFCTSQKVFTKAIFSVIVVVWAHINGDNTHIQNMFSAISYLVTIRPSQAKTSKPTKELAGVQPCVPAPKTRKHHVKKVSFQEPPSEQPFAQNTCRYCFDTRHPTAQCPHLITEFINIEHLCIEFADMAREVLDAVDSTVLEWYVRQHRLSSMLSIQYCTYYDNVILRYPPAKRPREMVLAYLVILPKHPEWKQNRYQRFVANKTEGNLRYSPSLTGPRSGP
jgi:hypothetical protein